MRVCPRDISTPLLDYCQRNHGSIVDNEISIEDHGHKKFKRIQGKISDGT
jgi:hypothetical protein